jgi:GGDEF domain-containing protein
LYDVEKQTQLAFSSVRPDRYWQVTWAFALERSTERSTRLHVRARAALPASGQLHAAWIRPVHHFMQAAMLRHLAARVEGRLPQNDCRDVIAGVGGAALMLAALLTPFLRRSRNHWGVEPSEGALSSRVPVDVGEWEPAAPVSERPPTLISVTVSLGAAELRGDEPFESLIRRADRALYAAKDLGRNRVQG